MPRGKEIYIPTDWEKVAEQRFNKNLDFKNIHTKEQYVKALWQFLNSTPNSKGEYIGRRIIFNNRRSFDNIANECFSGKVQRLITEYEKPQRKESIKTYKKERAVINNKDIAYTKTTGIRATIDKRGIKHYINKKGKYVKKPY
jgi:hypothetical protein